LLILGFVIPYLQERLKGAYYISRDWNGGPNIEVIYRGKVEQCADMEQRLQVFCTDMGWQWSITEINNNLKKYRDTQENLLKIERKGLQEIDINNHLRVHINGLDLTYYRAIYNSSEHVWLHFQAKFLLEPLIEETLEHFGDRGELLIFVTKLYHMIMNLYEFGDKFASMMFYSNIAGVFAIAKEYGKETVIEANYMEQYSRLGLQHLEQFYEGDTLLNRYQKAWKQIYRECEKVYDANGYYEEGYLTIDAQGKQMIKNVNGIASEFHHNFVGQDNIDEVISGRLHIIFRSIVNVFYTILGPLNINFLEKNFCCYAVCHYVFDKYNTTWDQIMEERRTG